MWLNLYLWNFFHVMNSYTKTWLQFVFPFYTPASLLSRSTFFFKIINSLLESILFLLLPRCCSCLIQSFFTLLLHAFNLVVYFNYDDSNIHGSTIDENYSLGRYPLFSSFWLLHSTVDTLYTSPNLNAMVKKCGSL